MTDDNAAVPIVDSHLDLAENVTFCGRDLTLTVQEIRERENQTDHQAMVTLPELQLGGVAVVFGTIFAGVPEHEASPERRSRPGVYSTAEEAEANALDQIDLYETWEKQGRRGGALTFRETITEYRGEDGELVVTARGVGVRTGQTVKD